MSRLSSLTRATLPAIVALTTIIGGSTAAFAAPQLAGPVCPTSAELLAAFQANSPQMYADAGQPAALTEVTCVLPYAVASTAETPDGDSVIVLAVFDADAQQWTGLNIGAGDVCPDTVPADIAAQLPGCEPTEDDGSDLPDWDPDDTGTDDPVTPVTPALKAPALNAPAIAAPAVSSIGGPITRAEVLQRAQGWVDHQPGSYSQTGFAWDPTHTKQYRRDCSGYVDMAWHISGANSTHNLSQISNPISTSGLRPGDAFNDAGAHVILFKAWKTDGRHFSYYTFGSAPVKIRTASIDSGYIDSHPFSAYRAIRYKNIVENTTKPPAERPDATASSRMVEFRKTIQSFARGTNNTLQHVWYDTTWHHETLGTGIAGTPTTLIYRGTLQTLVRAADNTLQHYWYDNAWHHENLGATVGGDPTATVFNDTIQSFSRGTGNTLEHVWYSDGWHHESLGTGIAGDPTAMTYNNSLQVFARGTSNTLEHVWYQTSTGWQRQSLGTGIAGDPTAITYNGSLQTFSRGTDGGLRHVYYQKNKWYSDTMATGLAGDPAVMVFNKSLQTFTRNTANTLQHTWYDGTWHTQDLTTGIAGDPSAMQFKTSLQAEVLGTGNTLRHIWYDGTWHAEVLDNTTAG